MVGIVGSAAVGADGDKFDLSIEPSIHQSGMGAKAACALLRWQILLNFVLRYLLQWQNMPFHTLQSNSALFQQHLTLHQLRICQQTIPSLALL
jgi:hypothetical protein